MLPRSARGPRQCRLRRSGRLPHSWLHVDQSVTASAEPDPVGAQVVIVGQERVVLAPQVGRQPADIGFGAGLGAKPITVTQRLMPNMVSSSGAILRPSQQDSQKGPPGSLRVVGLPRFELGTFGPPDHRNLCRTSIWTASARGFNDVCLTGTPVFA